MKLQAASRREISRIAAGTAVCDVLMIAVLFILSLVGVGTFSLGRVLLGALGGSVVAIANFTVLCLTVQVAADTESKTQMKAKFQVSYNLRLLLQAAWVVVCIVAKPIHIVAGIAPVLFPNVVIFFLQSRGKLMPKDEHPTQGPKDGPEDDCNDTLETFEV